MLPYFPVWQLNNLCFNKTENFQFCFTLPHILKQSKSKKSKKYFLMEGPKNPLRKCENRPF